VLISHRAKSGAFKIGVYGLLILGSMLFFWPLVWMIGTSVKLDRELFTETLHLFPERPVPAQSSPFVANSLFRDLKGHRSKELVAIFEKHLDGMVWPSGLDRSQLILQMARGLYMRMRNLLPKAAWALPGPDFAAAAIQQVDQAMLNDVLLQVRRSLLIGQLRTRSYDLQEETLVSAAEASRFWNIETGGAQARLEAVKEQGQDAAEIHYQFKPGQALRLSQTFYLSFPVKRLHRVQLSLRADESWHPLKVYLEKEGNLYEAQRLAPMADGNWAELTWQEPGPDDLSNKIRTWMLLKKTGSSSSYVSGPNQLKVILEFGAVDSAHAWLYKLKRNYLMVFDNMPFWRYAATSAFLVILNMIGTLFSCSVVAYSFARLRWPGRSLSYAIMLGTMMIPAQVTMIPFFLIIRWLGWYNTLTPLWFGSFFASAFNVFLLHQFFKGIPTDLEDAAKIDGCGPLRIYWYIMLPLIRPALATIAIFTFMGVWNDFMGPLIYLNDQRLYPLSLGLYALNVQAGGSMSMMMGGSLLMLLPVVIIFFFAQRYFIEGITMTGLKS
jgi:ABC-type glycerol-3-phosphate transport system permease component